MSSFMQDDGPINFIDRHEAIALFKLLYQRNPQRQHPHPILTFLASPGGGTSMFIEYLMRRCDTALPYAYYNFAQQDMPKMLPEMLLFLCEQLSLFENTRIHKLAFSRFYLVASILFATLPDDNPYELRKEINKGIISKFSFSEQLDDMSGALGNLVPIVPPFLILVKWILVTMQQKIPFFQAWFSRKEISWFKNSTKLLKLPRSTAPIDILIRLRAWSRPAQSEERLRAVEQLLFEAFMDDLRVAFDTKTPGAKERTTQVVLFLDNFDGVVFHEIGNRLLNMLIKDRLEGKSDPILLVLGSQQLPFELLEKNFLFTQQNIGIGEQSIEGKARAFYEFWYQCYSSETKRSASSLYLPFWLHDFNMADTSIYLSKMLSHESISSVDTAALIEESYRITYGHPLALTVAAKVLGAMKVQGRDFTVALFFQEPVPPDMPGSYSYATVEAYLLFRFLNRLSKAEQEQLTMCAAPHVLDIPTLKIALAIDSDRDAQDIWESYSRSTLVRIYDKHHLVFHPLLRDLLNRRLETISLPNKDYYKVIHSNLCEYYAELKDAENINAHIEEIYHALALGDPKPAISFISSNLDTSHNSVELALDVVAQAPVRFMPKDVAKEAFDAFYKYKLTKRLEYIVTALVLYTWFSKQSREQAEVIELLYNLGETYRNLPGKNRTLFQKKASECFEKANELTAGKVLAQFPSYRPYTSDLTPFPIYKVSHVRRTITTIVLLAILLIPLLIYPFVYFRQYAPTVCNPSGIFSFSTVLSSMYFSQYLHPFHALDGECIGISDGTFAFDITTNPTSGSYKTQGALALLNGDPSDAGALWDKANHEDPSDAETLIYKENQRILNLSQSENLPYITIIVFTSLTARDQSQKSVSTGRGDLQGAYVAQIEHNKDFHIPLLRLLIANTGGNSRYAPIVANQIIQAAHADSTIVGVMGPTQSRDESIAAIKILGKAHILMVSSTASSDSLTNISPYFFRMAPPNKDQVIFGVQYAINKLHIQTAALFEAENDNYSQNLAAKFIEQFQKKMHKNIVDTEIYDATDIDVSNMILEKAGHACSYNPDLIYFTGRTDEMIRLLNSLSQNSCGKNNDVHIMGGDTLYQLTDPPNAGYPPYAYNRLYYTSFSYPYVWEQSGLKQFKPAFFNDYASSFDPYHLYVNKPTFGYTLPDGHVTLAYDAISTFMNAIMNTMKITRKVHFDLGDPLRALRSITGAQAIQGASGRIDFGSVPNGDPIDKVIVMLHIDEHGNTELDSKDGITGRLQK